MLFWIFHRGLFFHIAIKVDFKCFYKKCVIVSQVHANGMCVDKSYNKRSVSFNPILGLIKNCPTFEKWVEIVIKINTYSIIGKYALLNSIGVRFNNYTKYISNIFKQLLNPLRNHNKVVIIV